MAFNMGEYFMGTEGTPGEHGIDTAYFDDYGDYQGMRDQMNDYWTGAMNFEESPGMKAYSEGILENDYASLDREYMGDPGDRSGSMFGNAMEAGSISGLGGERNTGEFNKVNYELQAKKAAAKAAMNKYRMDYMGEAAMRAPEGMAKLPQGQRGEMFPYKVDPVAGETGWLGEQFDKGMSWFGTQSPTDVADIAGTFFRGKMGAGADPTRGAGSSMGGQGNISNYNRSTAPSNYGGSKISF